MSEDEDEETQEYLEKAMLQKHGTCGQRCPEVEALAACEPVASHAVES